MKHIAALLTVFNRKQQTLACLDRLFTQDIPEGYSLTVYLVDDGSTDGTAVAILEQFPGKVNIIQGDGTLFWNRGMHLAWTVATKERAFDYYLWVNDDTFIYDGCISRLLSESKRYEDKSIVVGSTCAVGNPSKITYGGWQNGIKITDLENRQWCDEINGNIVLIPKYVYDILGTNDPYFRHAAGDTDYGLRAKETGVGCFIGKGIFGECDLHERPTVWMDPSQPFKKRWKNFFSPLGNNPFEFFYFKKKHKGLVAACITFSSMWIHFFFPWFWPRCYKKVTNDGE